MKTSHASILRVLLLALVSLTASAHAVLIESLNNTVADGTIVIDSSRTGWTGLTGFVPDPDEGLTEDWHQVTIASDSTNFYIRYQMNASAGWSGLLHMYIDTDLSRLTGYIGGQSQFSVGAEYMLEGGSLYSFTGSSQTTWGWNWISYIGDGSVPNDYVASFARSAVDTTTFNFALDVTESYDESALHDYYVDSAGSGASGGYLQYSAIPEPATTALLGVGLAWMLLVRHRRSC